MAVTIAMLAVGVATAVVGAVESSKNRKAAANQANQAIAAQKQIAAQTNTTNLEIGEASDISSVINATIQANAMNMSAVEAAAAQASLQSAGNAQVATINNEGNAFLIVGAGLIILSLAILVFRHKHVTTSGGGSSGVT